MNLSMLTDFYQITMAYAAWKNGIHRNRAVFHLFFRRAPFNNGFAIAAGLALAMELLRNFRFDPDDLEYLSAAVGNDGRPLFPSEFLAWLGTIRFDGSLDALPEGTAVFPHEPLLRLEASLAVAMLLETPLLNIINYQTLIATKAARIVQAAHPSPVIEFGMRRAHGPDGAVSATRAAYIGGVQSTSNVLAGKLLGIPVRGTHAHSWVMAFDAEEEAFARYADALPNNTIFLVDTYDTLEGVRRAAREGVKLKARGHRLIGIRLDSGDLVQLSIESRRILDDHGLTEALIVASNDLDEYSIADLKSHGARIDLYGVGTKLVTAYDQPALGGVYKLAAIRTPEATDWQYRSKRSEEQVKSSLPGIQTVLRFADHDRIGLDTEPVPPVATSLLVPVFRNGIAIYDPPALQATRKLAIEQLAFFAEHKDWTVRHSPALHELRLQIDHQQKTAN